MELSRTTAQNINQSGYAHHLQMFKMRPNVVCGSLLRLATPSWYPGMPLKLDETNISTKHNRLKNPNWRETDQLAIYKHGRGVELGCTEKQLQLSGHSGT